MSKQPQISKQNLIRLEHLKNKRMVVRFQGGREISGVLLSYDGGINLVFDQAVQKCSEFCPEDRKLGVAIVRGALIMSLFPEQGFEEIQNPFAVEGQQEQAG